MNVLRYKDAKAQGVPLYFTGQPCKSGHLSARYTSSGCCVECKRAKALDQKQAKSEYDQARYQASAEVIRERMRKWRALNSARHVESAKEWSAANPEKRRAISKSYKARRRTSEKEGDSTAQVFAWEQVAPKVCYWCGIACESNYHVDHYEPLSKGGKHTVSNLVIACGPCNLTKSAKDPYKFAATLGRLF